MSGDTSCADHINAWRVRSALNLDDIPGGVAPDPGAAPDHTDNLILEDTVAPNSFQHPKCGFGEETVITKLPTDDPVGPNPPTTPPSSPTTPATPQ